MERITSRDGTTGDHSAYRYLYLPVSSTVLYEPRPICLFITSSNFFKMRVNQPIGLSYSGRYMRIVLANNGQLKCHYASQTQHTDQQTPCQRYAAGLTE